MYSFRQYIIIPLSIFITVHPKNIFKTILVTFGMATRKTEILCSAQATLGSKVVTILSGTQGQADMQNGIADTETSILTQLAFTCSKLTTETRCEIRSKLTMKTPERRHAEVQFQ